MVCALPQRFLPRGRSGMFLLLFRRTHLRWRASGSQPPIGDLSDSTIRLRSNADLTTTHRLHFGMTESVEHLTELQQPLGSHLLRAQAANPLRPKDYRGVRARAQGEGYSANTSIPEPLERSSDRKRQPRKPAHPIQPGSNALQAQTYGYV